MGNLTSEFDIVHWTFQHLTYWKDPSENQFQAELNLAHLRGRGCNSPYIGIQGPRRILKDIIVGCAKVRMIQEVEKLCAELEVLPLPDPVVLRAGRGVAERRRHPVNTRRQRSGERHQVQGDRALLRRYHMPVPEDGTAAHRRTPSQWHA